MMTRNDLLKVEAAALALGVSKSHLYKLSRDTPGVYRFGRAVRYDVDELRSWGKEKSA